MFQGQNFVWNLTQYRTQNTFLFKRTHTKTRLIAKTETEVGGTAGLNLLDICLRRNGFNQPFRILGSQRRQIQRRHSAVQTNRRRSANFNMQVAHSFVHHQLQQISHFNIHKTPYPSRLSVNHKPPNPIRAARLKFHFRYFRSRLVEVHNEIIHLFTKYCK